MPGCRTIAKLIQRGEYGNASTSAPVIPDAREIVQVEMIELPHYHNPWLNCKPAPPNGMIPDGWGHDKFTYALDRKNPVLPYITPLPSVTAFTPTSSSIVLAEDDQREKVPADGLPVKREPKGPLGDVVAFLSGFANHLCTCCLSYYCTKKPHHPPAWAFEVHPPSAPKPAEKPCGSECYLLLPGPCRTDALDGDEEEVAQLHTILKVFLTEGPLCKIHKCKRPQCDGNCDRATCCQLAEIIERPCRIVCWVIQELINSTPTNCKPVRPRIPADLVPSIRLPVQKNARVGKRFQYKGCYHPKYTCSNPKANCRCHKYNTGCYDSCRCPLGCRLRNMCRCAAGCAGNKLECNCRQLAHMCVRCGVAADFGQKKVTKCGRSTVQGMGTFIMEDVPANAFVDEYTGELMTNTQNDLLARRPDCPLYSFDNNAEFTVDAWHYGNKTRFINHSAHNTNVRVKVVRVNGEHKIGMFAKRDLKAGEELFLKYVDPGSDRIANPSSMQTAMAGFIDVPLSPEELVPLPEESGLIHAYPLPKEREIYGRDVMRVTGVFCSDDVLSHEQKEELMRQLNDGPLMEQEEY